jgi:hypothetical protein
MACQTASSFSCSIHILASPSQDASVLFMWSFWLIWFVSPILLNEFIQINQRE